MVWSITGLTIAVSVAALAWRRSRSPGGFYAHHVYGMDERAHRRYAAVSLAFATYFAITLAGRFDAAGIAGLALYALVAVMYGTSFLRGAGDRDE